MLGSKVLFEMSFINPLFDDGDEVGSGFRIKIKAGFITDTTILCSTSSILAITCNIFYLI